MDNLRLVLIVLGGVAILGLLLHGLYVMRKNNSPKEQRNGNDEGMSPASMDFSKPTRVEPQLDAQGFDEYGVGKARVVSNDAEPKHSESVTQTEDDSLFESVTLDMEQQDNMQGTEAHWDDIPSIAALEDVPKAAAETPIDDEGPQYAPAVSNPKPAEHYQNKVKSTLASVEPDIAVTPPPAEFVQAESESVMPVQKEEPVAAQTSEQPLDSASESSLQPSDNVVDTAQNSRPDAPEKPEQKPKSKSSLASMLFGSRAKAGKKQRKVDENQFSIDFDSVDPVLNEAKEQSRIDHGGETERPKYDPNIPPEVLSISVKATAEECISGARLLPLLLTLGLKFGESDIFHRHVNNNGKGPVLFSLANMFKPGVFDIHHMETFETKGLTLFMTLPMESDAHQVFNMMYNAARKIADEFGAQVLDEARQELTVSGLPQYVERIRDFEKRRILG